MKYAWVENGVVRDVAINPSIQFHHEVAAWYNVEVEDNVVGGWIRQEDGSFAPPVVVEAAVVDEPQTQEEIPPQV